MEDIIPGLPNEIGRECLLRVPFIYHGTLRQVCQSWKATVRSPLFYQDRKRLKLNKQVIFVVRQAWKDGFDCSYEMCVYDPEQDAWRILCGIPTDEGKPNVLVVNQKLISIQKRRIMTYDFCSNSWSQVADVPNSRYDHVFSASPEGYIYFAGGDFNSRRTTLYNVDENKWESLPNMNRSRIYSYSKGIFIDGQFYVIAQPKKIEVFNTETQVWSSLKFKQTWREDCLIIAFGNLYSFKREGVMKYDSNKNVWRIVEPLPKFFFRVFWATVWNDQIFLSGFMCNGHKLKIVYYMYRPPTQGEVTSGRWISMKDPPNNVLQIDIGGIIQLKSVIPALL